MNATSTPPVQRRRLMAELQRARRAANLTQDQVASAMDWSLSKIIRIETGAVNVSTTDLMALLRHYGVTDSNQIDELVALARSARRRPSWWNRYREVLPPKILQFIELEEAASVIRSYEPVAIPGLLQTREYTETLLRMIAPPNMSPADLDARLEVRSKRQELVDQPERRLFFILDESVLRRLRGNKEIMPGQITRLINVANYQNVTIEVIQFNAGMYPGFLEPFSILEFPDAADPDVLYLESARDAVITKDQAGRIGIYRDTFDQLRTISLGPEDSLAYLRSLLQE